MRSIRFRDSSNTDGHSIQSASHSEGEIVFFHSLRERVAEEKRRGGEGAPCRSLGQNGPRWIEPHDRALPVRSSRPSQGEGEVDRTSCIPREGWGMFAILLSGRGDGGSSMTIAADLV
jgi:hypothetical protein